MAASSSFDDTASVWDIDKPKAPAVLLSAYAGWVTFVAFAPNGTWVATTHEDDFAIRIWDLREPGAPKMVLTGHKSFVKSLAFAPDSDRLASSSWDGTVRIWDLRQPEVAPLVLTGHKGYVESVAFSPDGNHLASGGQDKTILVWPIWSAAADYVCTQVWRNLSMKEWREFFGETFPYERTCPNLPPGAGVPGVIKSPARTGHPY